MFQTDQYKKNAKIALAANMTWLKTFVSLRTTERTLQRKTKGASLYTIIQTACCRVLGVYLCWPFDTKPFCLYQQVQELLNEKAVCHFGELSPTNVIPKQADGLALNELQKSQLQSTAVRRLTQPDLEALVWLATDARAAWGVKQYRQMGEVVHESLGCLVLCAA